MVIAARQQRGAGRRADRRGVKSVTALMPLPAFRVKVGGMNRPAIGFGLTKADIIQQDDENVGSALWAAGTVQPVADVWRFRAWDRPRWRRLWTGRAALDLP